MSFVCGPSELMGSRCIPGQACRGTLPAFVNLDSAQSRDWCAPQRTGVGASLYPFGKALFLKCSRQLKEGDFGKGSPGISAAFKSSCQWLQQKEGWNFRHHNTSTCRLRTSRRQGKAARRHGSSDSLAWLLAVGPFAGTACGPQEPGRLTSEGFALSWGGSRAPRAGEHGIRLPGSTSDDSNSGWA